MTADEEDRVIILMPARRIRDAVLVAGTKVTTAGCGHKALIAPSSVAFIAESGARTSCWDCVDRDALSDPDTPKDAVPGFRAELNATLGVAEADQLIAWAATKGIGQGKSP